jgi:hypothetical protein
MQHFESLHLLFGLFSLITSSVERIELSKSAYKINNYIFIKVFYETSHDEVQFQDMVITKTSFKYNKMSCEWNRISKFNKTVVYKVLVCFGVDDETIMSLRSVKYTCSYKFENKNPENVEVHADLGVELIPWTHELVKTLAISLSEDDYLRFQEINETYQDADYFVYKEGANVGFASIIKGGNNFCALSNKSLQIPECDFNDIIHLVVFGLDGIILRISLSERKLDLKFIRWG